MKLFITIALLATLATSAMAGLFSSVGKPVCGGRSSSKKIQLKTPHAPPRECVYEIEAHSKYVCQLRVDLKYNLAQPTVPGWENMLKYTSCEMDYFQAGDLKLCGEETSQHIYVPFNRTGGVKSLDMRVVLANRVGYHNLPTPSWDITITQLECPVGASVRSLSPDSMTIEGRSATTLDGYLVAPPGCLQYFPQPSGTVTSFNFIKGKGVYPGHMNYAICFRRSTATKDLRLSSTFFQLGLNSYGQKTDDHCYGNNITSSDYLMIPQAKIEKKGQRVTYFCGDSMKGQEVVSSNPGPLMVLFNSDDSYQHENGFSFKYNVV